MGTDFNSAVFTDVPPMPNSKVLANTIPTAAPVTPFGRYQAQYVADQEGMVSASHNSTVATPSLTLMAWSDVAGYWIQLATQACAQFGQVTWKVTSGTLIYIFSSAALTGAGAVFVVGGVTIQGNGPVANAGD